MAIKLKVTPEVLIKMADSIGQEINDMENQFNSMGDDIKRTKSFWEGDASNSHQTQYDEIKDEIREVIKRLKDHPKNLLTMAGLYEETESEAQETALSLTDDVIV